MASTASTSRHVLVSENGGAHPGQPAENGHGDDSWDGAVAGQVAQSEQAVLRPATDDYAEMKGEKRAAQQADAGGGSLDGKTMDDDVLKDRQVVSEGTSITARANGTRKASGEDDDDDEDLVAMTHDDTILQDGGYQQVGLRAAEQPTEIRPSEATRKALMRRIAINLLLIVSWFFFSTLMNVYNSWFFSDKRKNFSYPLFVTSIHMTVQFCFAATTMTLCARNRKIVPRRRNGKRARPTARDWASKVVPCALATALDIGLSNISLKTITLSFYTMCKSSNLAFVLIFAFLFGLEKLRLSLVGIIAIITVGVVMMVAAETEFVLSGAVEVLSASALGGLRWALMQILLCRRAMGMDNPIATMFWLSPLMAFFMVTGSFVIEDWRAMFTSAFFADAGTAVETICFMILPGMIVVCMTLSEFALIMRTSVMTLSVAGIFKEILTILLSIAIFGDELTPINVTGLIIALSGIALYNYLKWRLLVDKTNIEGEAAFKVGRRRAPAHVNFGVGDDDDWSGDDEEETHMIRDDAHATHNGRDYTERGAEPTVQVSGVNTSIALQPNDRMSIANAAAPPHRAAALASSSPAAVERPDGVPPAQHRSDYGQKGEDGEDEDEDEDDSAEMRAWETAGTKRTGNGYYDGSSDDD